MYRHKLFVKVFILIISFQIWIYPSPATFDSFLPIDLIDIGKLPIKLPCLYLKYEYLFLSLSLKELVLTIMLNARESTNSRFLKCLEPQINLLITLSGPLQSASCIAINPPFTIFGNHNL
jgi:hypothetical protein